MISFLKFSFTVFTLVNFVLLNAQTPKLQLIEIATGLEHPIDIKHCGDERIFFIEQRGLIYIMEKNGTVNPEPFLDIVHLVNSTNGEQGLLGMAFSPNYKTDGTFFVNYIAGTGAGRSVIARFSVNPVDSNKALLNSQQILFELVQPGTTHNGGNMMFGKDGYLYISFGDGGGGNFSQDLRSFHSKILRINPFKGTLYAIPNDNPYVGQANIKEEIWVSGLRNAWRCSFDKITGDLWIADVGQDLFEEINFQPAASTGGENYGWRCYESFSPYNTSGCKNQSEYDFPVYHYQHSMQIGCSVTGGYVYRGAQFPNMFGKYFFTDACTGIFWSITQTQQTLFDPDTLGKLSTSNLVTFGEDNEGELYVGGFSLFRPGSGKIWKLIDTSNCKPVAFFTLHDTLETMNSSLTLKALSGKNLKYQWKLNDQILPGDTLSTISVTKSGNYSVVVFNKSCSAESKKTYVSLNITSTIDKVKENELIIFPNPNHGNFTVRYKDVDQNFSKESAMYLFNNMGEMIFMKIISPDNKFELQTLNLNAGLYFLEVRDQSVKTLTKLFVL